MGLFFVYILKSSVCLAIFYLFYRLLLARETFHRFNRFSLLGILLLSCLLPLVEVSVKQETEVHQTMLTLEQLLMMADAVNATEAGARAETATVIWIQVALLVYLAGIVFFAFRNVYSLVRLLMLLKSGKKEDIGSYLPGRKERVTLIVHNCDIAPFSWMGYIVISRKDLEENGREILIHELAHIHNRHSWDLLVADVCIFFQWFNPASWLLKQELQNIHEFEADETVIKEGVDAKQYQGVAALADVGRGGIDHGHAVLDADLAAAGIGQAHAHAGVLHGAGNASMSGMRVVGILDLEQCLLQCRGAVGNLAVGQNLARLDGVTVANLPRIQADLLGQQVDQALERKLGLAHAKAAERTGGRVVGVVAKAANVGVLVLVGTDGVRAGALEHRAAQRRVGAGIKVDLAVQTGKVALGVAAQRKGAVHGVAFGMERERLGTRELALHRTLELIGSERGQVLDGHVLLAAKAAAHEHGLDDHALGLVVPAKHVGTLFARVVGTLVGRLHLDAILVREGNGALGLQEGMLGKGRGKALRHGKRAFCQRLGGVAARHVTALAHVVLELHRVAKGKEAVVQARGVGSPGLGNVTHGLQRLVIDLYELLGLLERRLVLGDHQHDGIAHAAGDIARRDHDVPVLDKVADLVDRHVLGAQDAHHAGQGLGL